MYVKVYGKPPKKVKNWKHFGLRNRFFPQNYETETVGSNISLSLYRSDCR